MHKREAKSDSKKIIFDSVPAGWKIVTLGDVCAHTLNGGTPSTSNKNYWDGNIPWITSADILDQKIEIIRRFITKEAVQNSSTHVVPKGNLLITTRTGMGKLAVAPFDLAISQDITGFIPNDSIEAEYLFGFLNGFNGFLQNLNQGTSINGITRKDLFSIAILLPPLQEQRKIAAILSSLGDVIDKTEKIIIKTDDLKRDLMNRLLSKGIDHTEFQSSNGFPKEWKIAKIGDVAHVTKLAGFEFTDYFKYTDEGEIIALRALNIKNGKLDLTNVKRIKKEVSDKLPRSKINEGDILITYIGAYIGDILLINESKKYHLAPNVAKITVKNGMIPQFLEFFLLSKYVKYQYKKLTATTATPSLTMQQIRKIVVAKPDESEQQRIATVLLSIDKKLEAEKGYCNHLKKIKRGLMHDLLTGKVRVKVDDHA